MPTFTVGQVAYVHVACNDSDLACGDTTVVKVARTGTVYLANKMHFKKAANGTYLRGDSQYGFTLHDAPRWPWNAKGLTKAEREALLLARE